MSLSIGHVVNQIHATALPMPDDMVIQINCLVQCQQSNPRVVFMDRNFTVDEEEKENNGEYYKNEENDPVYN